MSEYQFTSSRRTGSLLVRRARLRALLARLAALALAGAFAAVSAPLPSAAHDDTCHRWGCTCEELLSDADFDDLDPDTLEEHERERAELDCLTPEPAAARQEDDDDVVATAYEIWAGIDVRPTTWTTYAGMTVAFGDKEVDANLDAPGMRFRSDVGYGAWSGTFAAPGHITASPFDSASAFASGLLGWQDRLSWQTTPNGARTTWKAFAGVTALRKNLTPARGNKNTWLLVSTFGAKAALETWTDFSDGWFLQFDVSGAYLFDRKTKFATFGVDWYGGRRLSNRLAMGVTGSVYMDGATSDSDIVKFGDAGTLKLGGQVDWALFKDVTLSLGAGVATNFEPSNPTVGMFDTDVTPVATAKVTVRF